MKAWSSSSLLNNPSLSLSEPPEPLQSELFSHWSISLLFAGWFFKYFQNPSDFGPGPDVKRKLHVKLNLCRWSATWCWSASCKGEAQLVSCASGMKRRFLSLKRNFECEAQLCMWSTSCASLVPSCSSLSFQSACFIFLMLTLQHILNTYTPLLDAQGG